MRGREGVGVEEGADAAVGRINVGATSEFGLTAGIGPVTLWGEEEEDQDRET